MIPSCRWAAVLVLMLMALFAASASATDLSGYQPPAPYGVFSTFSAETPPAEHSAVSFAIEKSGNPDYYRFSSQLAFGITNSMEFGMNLPYVDTKGDAGMEDITFTFKHRFFDEGKFGPSMAYLLAISMSANNEEFSMGGGVGLGLALTKRIGPFKAMANAIISLPNDKDYDPDLRGSVGVVFSADHSFNLMAEILARKSYLSDSIDFAEARFGYRFIYQNDLYTNVGIGVGLNEKMPDYRAMVSLAFLFPHKERTTQDKEAAK